MSTPIKLLVGLGNPGPEYALTRHNAGAWFVEQLAADCGLTLKPEKKFNGLVGQAVIANRTVRLLIPQTFMNLSGQSIGGCCQYYNIAPEEVLIAHDELDLEPGTARLKVGGGHGGHNGLKNTVAHLNTKDFARLRIGIGHPGDRNKVSKFVLSPPRKEEIPLIEESIDKALGYVNQIVSGEFEQAMNQLHQKN